MNRIVDLKQLDIHKDVIVIKEGSVNYNQIGSVVRVKNSEPPKISVSFDGEIFNYFLEDLCLA